MKLRIRGHKLLSFVSLGLLFGIILLLFRLELFNSEVAATLEFLSSLTLSAIVILLVVTSGVASSALYSKRAMGVIGLLAFVLGVILLASIIRSKANDPFVSIVAGVSIGGAWALGFTVWIASGIKTSLPTFAYGLFGAMGLAILEVGFGGENPWILWGLIAISGCLVFGLGLADNPVKNIKRPSLKLVLRECTSPLIRLAVGAFLLAMTWGYSLCHFYFYPLDANFVHIFVAAFLGLALGIFVLWLSSRLSKRHTLDVFILIRLLPVGMVYAFIPLDYLEIFVPGMSMCTLVGSGVVAVPALILAAKDIAAILEQPEFVFVGWTTAFLLLGASGGVVFHMLFGFSVDSVLWALAPGLCLGLGIIVCEFVLTRAPIMELAAKRAESQFSIDRLDETGDLRARCVGLASECGLTMREVDVLCMLVQGYSIPRVCESLHIAEGTATTHRRHIYQKLNVHTKNELIDRVKRYEYE